MKQSAGILVYRRSDQKIEVLLVHPGGPFWARKDSWSIPKGELEEDEELLSGARREFAEEVGSEVPAGDLLELGESKQASKTNHIWAVEGDVNLSHFDEARDNNMVKLEWPPRSGKQIEFAENDKVAWFELATAHAKVFKNQAVFVERLSEQLGISLDEPPESPAQQTLL